MRLGFVVNPVAGMGGRVGLKGTDGKVAEALERGAEPRAPDRARRALSAIADALPGATVLTWGDPMGASLVRAAGFEPTVLGRPDGGAPGPGEPAAGEGGADRAARTTAADTREAVRAMRGADADVVAFVGGDGTAADVAAASEGEVPILGVPAGVKVYSSVFAVSPEEAATVLATYDRVEDREVLDIDEDAYRSGTVDPELKAVVPVPVAEPLQSSKQVGGGSVGALAEGFAESVDPDTTYVFGPGSTVGAIERALGADGSPLGVDVWRDGELLVRDGSEAEILDALGERNEIVVSPIGGQGFVFGRGNPQLSPAVIRQCEVTVVASRAKLDGLGELRVDTDDPDLDAELRGWTRVRVGRVERRMMRIV